MRVRERWPLNLPTIYCDIWVGYPFLGSVLTVDLQNNHKMQKVWRYDIMFLLKQAIEK